MPLDAFELTLPVTCIEMLFLYTNQKYDQYCQQHPRDFVVECFGGYCLFSDEKVQAFMGLSFLSGAHKRNQQPIIYLDDSKFLPDFKTSLSEDWLALLIRICCFDNAKTRDEHNDDTPCSTNHCRELYGNLRYY